MKIVFTPDWFTLSDVLIETFSFFILLTFFLLSIKSYKLSKKKNTLYIGIGFLLIAVAEIASIFTKLILFYDVSFTQEIGRAIVTYNVIKSVDVLYYAGFFFYKFLTLWGLYIIYGVSSGKKARGDLLLAIYFMLISALLSSAFYYVFYLTALILTIFIIRNYYKIYSENKMKSTAMLLIAFCMLALSQIIFILSKLNTMYVTGQIIQMISYIILLALIIRILKHGKETNKNADNIRYAGNYTRKRRKN